MNLFSFIVPSPIENNFDLILNFEKLDNEAVDGGQMAEYEGKVDEPKMNEEDSAPRNVEEHATNAPEMEKHDEPLNRKADESVMEETGGRLDGGDMNDKMSQENGAKRIKEECICPVLGKYITHIHNSNA